MRINIRHFETIFWSPCLIARVASVKVTVAGQMSLAAGGTFSTRSLWPLCMLRFWPTRVWRPLSGDCVFRTSFITSRLYLLFILFYFIFLAIGADTMIPFLFWQLFHFFRNWSTDGLFRFLGSQTTRTAVFGWMFPDFWQFSFWVFNSVVVQKHPALVSPVHWLLVPWVRRCTAALSRWHLWVARGNRDELQQIELPHQDASWVTCVRCTYSSVIKSVFELIHQTGKHT